MEGVTEAVVPQIPLVAVVLSVLIVAVVLYGVRGWG